VSEVTPEPTPVLSLRKNEERRLKAGHLWVYSNEIDTKKTPIKEFAVGSTAAVYSDRGDFCGMVYINPHSLIAGRIYSTQHKVALDKNLFVERIEQALKLRKTVYTSNAYRLIHSEGDLLPGLVVDRYEDILVVQISTAGMQAVEPIIVEALVACIQPKGIYVRSTSSMRKLEGLESREEKVYGDVPEVVRITENDLQFDVPMMGGQKTGWFYDHRDNRLALRPHCEGKRVLDGFSYLGAWGMNALAAGASEVVAIDSSTSACEAAQRNAELNSYEDRFSVITAEIEAGLEKLRADKKQFDVIVLDPPALIQRAKDKRNGLEKYRKINTLAMSLLADCGVLVSASCSYHLTDTDLQRVMLQAAKSNKRSLQIIGRGHQGADHPVHAAIPETEYLKAIFARTVQ